ncbi:MAG: phosphoglycerate dehydrogenase [Sporocytophaga sp.]|uniref:NAD(P)-dependent oxidoreductase n=1 Tax=Sporocytophaga sp. TaxID=2231183 RepID=UPI001B1376C5|nr:NAD(P)-dependent oxidoreductase [Sporocytophaga sp.]MBO9701203.1 phosphoglycerate dehydrogenase [Sporocytophaga sp.]
MKFIIVDEMHPSIVSMLEGIGIVPDYRPSVTRVDLLKIIMNYDGLMVRSKVRIDKELLDIATNLKIIARAGAGLDQIDIEEVEHRKIKVVNAPEGNRDAVGEHAVGMLLSLMNKMQTGDKEVRNGIWKREKNRGYEVGGLTIGIIGYGNMGKAFAKRIKGFGCRVIAYDKYLSGYGDEFAEEVSMEEIFKDADVLSLHIPLTEVSRRMVDKKFIENFKKDFWLVNTARGEVVLQADLIDALNSGKIRGAALDVLENEKFETLTSIQKLNLENLVERENVLFTPHVAGWTYESLVKINEVLVEKLRESIAKI